MVLPRSLNRARMERASREKANGGCQPFRPLSSARLASRGVTLQHLRAVEVIDRFVERREAKPAVFRHVGMRSGRGDDSRSRRHQSHAQSLADGVAVVTTRHHARFWCGRAQRGLAGPYEGRLERTDMWSSARMVKSVFWCPFLGSGTQ